jgi:3-methyladenine DNA glycosylase AlkC
VAEPLKNLYNKEYISLLSSTLKNVYPQFDSEAFKSEVFDNTWNQKELKERMRRISTLLGRNLPKNYKEAITILRKTQQSMNHSYALENIIFQDFVEIHGLNDFKTSMGALESFTINSTSEFAIRKFILKYPQETMQQMNLWAASDNEHLRRLASEGCRPSLPWAIALIAFKKNPKEVLKILEILKDDKSIYVRKSVANNINDISKDNPVAIINLAKRWLKENPNREWILKHGCRTLLKNSNQEVLNLFGFSKPDNISLNEFKIQNSIKMGSELEFSFTLNSQDVLGKLRLEFAIEFVRKNGKCNTKVFKISEGTYTIKNKKISKIYSFKPISTRVYYKGLHKLSIIINGVVFAKQEFLVN